MHIIGAGLSGLICGALNAQSIIYERATEAILNHKAVLRFRDDKIARALGLTFRKVTVRKAIWTWDDDARDDEGSESLPTPRLANLYSMKVRGVIADNSLWNLAPVERFIAPENLHLILSEMCGTRIHWGAEINLGDWTHRPIISTIPLPVLLKQLSIEPPFEFQSAPIKVDRYRVPNCDVFQTIYFPDPFFPIYRATLTGDLLTLEGVESQAEWDEHEVISVITDALGLYHSLLEPIEHGHRQQFGKITPVPDGLRKALLHRLTLQHGIYSLGRFATWRNVLLDDVFDDIMVIRRMMTHSNYDLELERTR